MCRYRIKSRALLLYYSTTMYYVCTMCRWQVLMQRSCRLDASTHATNRLQGMRVMRRTRSSLHPRLPHSGLHPSTPLLHQLAEHVICSLTESSTLGALFWTLFFLRIRIAHAATLHTFGQPTYILYILYIPTMYIAELSRANTYHAICHATRPTRVNTMYIHSSFL